MTHEDLLIYIDMAVEKALKSAKPANDTQTAFKKTEQLMWNYTAFHHVLLDKREYVNELTQYGAPSKSSTATEYHDTRSNRGLETREESASGIVKGLKSDIMWLEAALTKIEHALNVIRDDEHYDIIERYYVHGESTTDIAKDYGVDRATVSKWKNALIRKMSFSLFPKEAVTELMEV